MPSAVSASAMERSPRPSRYSAKMRCTAGAVDAAVGYLDAIEARAEHSAKAAQNAALDTRRAKVYDVDANTLRADWAQRAEAVGFGPVQVTELLQRGVTREPQLWSVGALFDDLASPTGVTERASTFGRRDVVRAVAQRMPDGADVTAIEDLADGLLGERRVVEVAGDPAGRPSSCC